MSSAAFASRAEMIALVALCTKYLQYGFTSHIDTTDYLMRIPGAQHTIADAKMCNSR